MDKFLRMLVVVIVVLAVSYLAVGCTYADKAEALLADGITAYCERNTSSGREIIREGLHPELVSEGVEICLGCPGDLQTACTGAHRPKDVASKSGLVAGVRN